MRMPAELPLQAQQPHHVGHRDYVDAIHLGIAENGDLGERRQAVDVGNRQARVRHGVLDGLQGQRSQRTPRDTFEVRIADADGGSPSVQPRHTRLLRFCVGPVLRDTRRGPAG